MRRVISLSLMVLFSLALMTPFFAPDADSKLPACCRRSGRHHCMMRLMGEGNRREPGFTTVTEKCPCSPFSASAAHSQGSSTDAGDEFYAEIRRHPACAPQTEALYRLSLLRSHQKRGPPSFSLIA
jgi:hypothetical protein